LAIGMEAKALQAGSVAIGANSTTARANTFAVGGTGLNQQRQVVNVAAGTLANDATNVEQIKQLVGATELTFDTNGQIQKLTLDASKENSLAKLLAKGKADNGGNTSVDDSNAVKYTDEYTVTLNADTTKPDAPVYTKLTNVANGAVEENSVDAVNGHQLNEVKQTAQANSTALAHTVKADDFNQFKVDLGKNLLAVAETDGLKTVTVGAQLEGGVMSIAGMSGARQLTGVAMGGGDDNAVNVEQLKNVLGGEAQFNADGTLKSFKPEGAKKAFGNLSEAFKASLDAKVGGDDGETGTNVGADPLAVSYANADKAEIQLQGANGTTITNVADGSLDPASLDAVNGRQLGKVAAEVELQADAIKGIDEEVKTQAMSIAALDINVRENTGAILENTTAIEQLSSGQAGLVTAEAGGALQVGAAMGGNAVNIAGTDGARKLTGLANGEGETDAVTFAQLKAYTQDADGKATFPTVKYDDGNLKMVTFGGTGGTVLNGVAAGEIAAGSQQAVNGGQLFTYQQEIKQFAEAVGAVVNDHQDRLSDLDRAVRQVGERPVTSGNLAELTGGEANGEGSVALGKNSRAQREDGGAVKNAVAFGDNSNASADNSTAIGTNARSTAKNAVALGQDSVADREDTVSVGSEGHERQISHVASAKAGTDAVNLDQLNASVADGVQQSNNYTDQRIGGVQSQLNDVAKNAYSGIAAATALTMIPDVDMGKTLSFGIGASTFKGYKAVALGGTARIHDNIKVKAGVGLSSGGSTVGVGASYQW
uniref:YadA family autotransporter adhesin n=1 Tax=Burkholderia ambifaria TaxID=152480 RepID=UPI001ABBA37A